MSGKRCSSLDGVPRIRESKAYCEGRAAAVAGILEAANPHTANSRDADEWEKGHQSYAGGVGSPIGTGCCADMAYDGVP